MQWSCKVYHLPLGQTSHTRLNNLYQWFSKANNSCSIYKHLHVFYLTDDRNALSYNLEFSNCYHHQNIWIKIRFQETNYVKFMNWVIGFKHDQLRKIMRSYAIKVPVADSKFFFAVFCLGPGQRKWQRNDYIANKSDVKLWKYYCCRKIL